MDLFKGLLSVSKDETAGFLADAKVYSIHNNIKKDLSFIYYGCTRVAQIIAQLINKNIEIHKPETLSQERKNVYLSYKNYSVNQLIDDAQERIRIIVNILGGNVNESKDVEMISSQATRCTKKLYGNKHTHGMSISEINEYIYKNYHNYKENAVVKLISLCRLKTIAFIGIVLTGLVIMHNVYALFVMAGLLAADIFISYMCSKKIYRIHCSRFIWLAVSGFGGNVRPNGNNLPLGSMGQLQKDNMTKSLKACHSLLNMISILNEQKQKNVLDKQLIKKEIEKNEKIIRQTVSSSEFQSDKEANRIVNGKKAENSKLYEQISILSNDITEKDKNINDISKMLNASISKDINELQNVWVRFFLKIKFGEGIMRNIAYMFSLDDIMGIEQNLYELNLANNPVSIANVDKNRYYVNFHTIQGDLCRLYFACDKQQVVINDVYRSGKLKETYFTNDEMQQWMMDNSCTDDEEISNLIESFEQERRKWTEEKENIAREKKELEKKADGMLDEIVEKQNECDKLEHQVKELDTECNGLKIKIKEYEDNGGDNTSQIEELNNELEKKSSDYKKLLEEYEQSKSDVVIAYDKIDKLIADKDKLDKKLDSSKKRIEKEKERHKKEVVRLKDKYNKEKEKIIDERDQAQSSYNLTERLYQKAIKQGGIDKDTIKKLESNLTIQKRKREELESKNNKKDSEIDELNKQIKQLEDNYNNDIPNDEWKEQVYYDKAIVEKFLFMLKGAKESIYIVCPTANSKIAANLLNGILRDSVKKYPGLKIKVLCGLIGNKSFNEGSNNSKYESTRDAMEMYKKELGENHFRYLMNDIHTKLIIIDNREFFIGSLNFLNFLYYSPNDNRHEISLWSNNKKQCERLIKEYFKW